jgi:hypothetical protein
MTACTGEIALPRAADRRNGSDRRTIAGVAVILLALSAAVWANGAAKSEPRAATAIAPTTALLGAGAEIVDFGLRPSHNGRYFAEVVGTGSTLSVGAAQSWIVRISRRDRLGLDGARLTVRTWMPETGELSPALAEARALGDGRYAIDNITLSRPGWWNVALVIDGTTGTDSLAFNLRLR